MIDSFQFVIDSFSSFPDTTSFKYELQILYLQGRGVKKSDMSDLQQTKLLCNQYT